MKKIFLYTTTVASIIACTATDKIEIKGTIAHSKPSQKIYLSRIDDINNVTLIDSTVLNEKGEFIFSPATKTPAMYRLQVGETYLPVIGKEGDQVRIEYDLQSKSPDFTISGNDESEKLNELTKKMTVNFGEMQKLQDEFAKQSKEIDNATMVDFQNKYETLAQKFNADVLKIANENTDNLVGLYALMNLDEIENGEAFLKFADKVPQNLKSLPLVTSFLKKTENARKTAIGQAAPDFSGQSIDGKTIKLSDLKGKYVLVDFWASWCGPCRQENPNVVKAYQKYKNKNFEILGFSLDNSAEDWKKAIKDDQLNWMHISDLKGFKSDAVSLYNVTGIPFNFLINPEGKIIAKNLRGPELEKTLAIEIK